MKERTNPKGDKDSSNIIDNFAEEWDEATIAKSVNNNAMRPIPYCWVDEYEKQKLTVDFLVHCLPWEYFRHKLN
jgi:hypothetical protein